MSKTNNLTGRVTTTATSPSSPLARSARLPLPLRTTPTRWDITLPLSTDAHANNRRTPPTSPRLSSPLPTPSAWVLLSTSPSSTTRFSTRLTVLATSLSRPLTTPLPSSTRCPRSRTATAPSSCSCSVTTSPSGPRLTRPRPSPAPTPPRRTRPRPPPRSPLRRPRLRSLLPLLPLNLTMPLPGLVLRG